VNWKSWASTGPAPNRTATTAVKTFTFIESPSVEWIAGHTRAEPGSNFGLWSPVKAILGRLTVPRVRSASGATTALNP
jgi:hypothetical protein